MSKTTTSQSSASPVEVRRLVLEYLCNNCYTNTARAFARDSTPRELDKDGDEIILEGNGYDLDLASLCFVQTQKEIQARILAGHIPECIELLNKRFPDVLSPKFTGSLYDPNHLRLNLKIQHFIELARTLPLPWPHDIGEKLHQQILNGVVIKEEEDRNRRLISLMHELWSLVYSLPGTTRDREIYTRELKAVGGLLTYPIPEKSRALRKYLDKIRREAVADQINDAILYRMGKTVPSIIELAARQTTTIFDTLHGLNFVLPATEQRPAILKSLLSSKSVSLTQDTKLQKTDKDKENAEIIPVFQLDTLLGTEA